MSRLLFGAILFAPLSAFAGTTPCADRETLLGQLNEHYSEAPVAIGLDSQGRMLEVLAAGSGGTWTILVTSPTGQACLVSSGTAFESAFAPVLVGDPA